MAFCCLSKVKSPSFAALSSSTGVKSSLWAVISLMQLTGPLVQLIDYVGGRPIHQSAPLVSHNLSWSCSGGSFAHYCAIIHIPAATLKATSVFRIRTLNIARMVHPCSLFTQVFAFSARDYANQHDQSHLHIITASLHQSVHFLLRLDFQFPSPVSTSNSSIYDLAAEESLRAVIFGVPLIVSLTTNLGRFL